jgi:hypothetical protein
MGRNRNFHITCKCGKPTSSVNSAYCRDCWNAYQKTNRKKHSELTEGQRKKANARSYVNVYIRRGLVIRKCCEACGAEKSQAHHPDYDKPLEVIWLCKPCHMKEHGINISDISPAEIVRVRNRKGNPKSTCSKCSKPLDESRVNKQRYCKKCHAEHMRNSRKLNKSEGEKVY